MIFNSVTYLLFLLIVVILYWQLPQRPRLWLIFLSSLVFYGFWRVEFLFVMLFSAFIDFFAAQKIYQAQDRYQKRLYLMLSLGANLGLLFYFKYLLFATNSFIDIANYLGFSLNPVMLNIILPLGISFYTFQTISYTIDVYRGFVRPERDFLVYGCFVTFFPQLVAGPILRAGELVTQLVKRHNFDLTDIEIGIRRILYGLFLKVVLADNIAPLVDAGFEQTSASLSAIDIWTLAFLFGFQIYFDFSAYSHIALGSARLMGIHLPENFNFPYLANSPVEFWRRWHISLSSWIRDYLYLPLAGAKVQDRSVGGLGTAVRGLHTPKRRNTALFATWAIMGLWHGANWTFLVWGLYHAMLVFAYRILTPLFSWFPRSVQSWGGWAITLPAAMLGWIPFRASSVSETAKMFGTVFQPAQYTWLGLRENTYLITALLLVGILITYYVIHNILPLMRRRVLPAVMGESMAFAVMFGLVFVFLRPIKQFIYFQF
jgi:D-alanyl-lipoteichoic acid acyltransferase DltB (MBOAT superfamily)